MTRSAGSSAKAFRGSAETATARLSTPAVSFFESLFILFLLLSDIYLKAPYTYALIISHIIKNFKVFFFKRKYFPSFRDFLAAGLRQSAQNGMSPLPLAGRHTALHRIIYTCISVSCFDLLSFRSMTVCFRVPAGKTPRSGTVSSRKARREYRIPSGNRFRVQHSHRPA